MNENMASGWILITRDPRTKGIYVDTTDDWLELVEGRRLIYCQAVSDVDKVQEKLDRFRQDDSHDDVEANMNDRIAELVSSVQWIANDFPLRSFRSTQTILTENF